MPGSGLAIAGAIGIALTAGRALPLSGEASEWAQYLLVGIATPLAVLWLAGEARPRALTRGLAWLGAVAALCYVAWSGRWIALALAAGQVLLAAAVARRPPAWREVVVAAFAWAAVMPLTRNFDPQRDTLGEWMARGGLWWLAIDAAVIACVTGSLAAHERTSRERPTRRQRAVWLLALAVLGLESFHADYLFLGVPVAMHHWGLFIAPAETVRQGGWLLWDTPATYGPGAVLAIAAMPTNTWDGFFWLNVLACFASAAVLFGLARERMNAALALAVVLCAVLWLPGAAGGGVLVTPNAAPFRFIWCQVLLVIAAYRPRRPAVLVATCLLWLVGCIWSFESAVYCSAAWLPAYLLLVWDAPRRARLAYVALPPALLAAAAAAIVAYYTYYLGHAPDWYGFVEGVVAVGGKGVWAMPVDAAGPVAVLLLVLWVSAQAAMRVTAAPRSLADVAPTWAAMSFIWAVSSYFVGRSHPITVTNLLPMLLLVCLIALREPSSDTSARAACTVLVAAVLLFALHDRSGWEPHRPIARRWIVRVSPRLPTLTERQLEIMKEAGIRPGDAIAYHNLVIMPAWPASMGPTVPDRVWLPIYPLIELLVVSDERRELYVQRFSERTRSGGWLLMPTKPAAPPWLSELLAPRYRATRTVTTPRWRATYYEYAEN